MKNADTESVRKMREIEKKYNIETANMVHIHCCGGGGGQMVLHGFVLHNCFEIVWIDTDHEKHKVQKPTVDEFQNANLLQDFYIILAPFRSISQPVQACLNI